MATMSGDPIRVAFVIDDLGYAGAQKQLSILVEALRPDVAPQVHCLSPREQPYGDLLRERGIPVRSYARTGGLDVGRLFHLVRALRREPVDLVHGFLDAADVYAYVAARLLGIPALLSLRTDRLRLAGWRARLLRHCLRHASAVTVNSGAAGRHAVDIVGVSPERVVVIPNAHSGDVAAPARAPVAAPVIGYVGRFKAYKRIDLLIAAFSILLRTRPDARLVLVGDGEEMPRLREQARPLGDRVEFTGAVGDAPKRMRAFTCLVVVSLSEGLSNAAMEAIAAGVPVVAYPSGDLADIVRDGVTGRVVTDDSAAGLAALLAEVIGDAALAAAAAENGPRLVRGQYSPQRAADAILPTYRRLMTKEKRLP